MNSVPFDYNPKAITAAPAAATTRRLLCSFVPAPMISDGTVLALGVAELGVAELGVAALTLLVAVLVAVLLYELDKRTMVDVAVA